MNKNLIRRGLCAAMIGAMALSVAACANTDQDTTTAPVTETTAATASATTSGTTVSTEPAAEGSINMLSVSMTLEGAADRYIQVNRYAETNTYMVDYVGDVRKQAELEADVLSDLAAQVESSGLAALKDKSENADGSAYASMYVEFMDGTMLSADYTGKVSQEYQDAYKAMDAYFQTILADVPEYVSKPSVAEGVNEQTLAEIQAIMASSGIVNQDTMMITDVPKDDFFGTTVGLSNTDGIANATSCGSMMTTTAYSFVVVTLDEGTDAKAVMDDFQSSMDWRKWVCVAPSNALVAQKDNMVLCLMGSDQMFEQTKTGIEANGWQNLVVLDNPDM